jgi:hypothetical protein
MYKIKFVIVSKDDTHQMSQEYIDNSLKLDDVEVTVDYILNNKKSLCTCYNEKLREIRIDNQYDYVFFMHADVKTNNLTMLLQQVIVNTEKYDIMGLCGCDKISYGVTPLNWFTGSSVYPDNRWGFVFHGELNAATYFSQKYPNVSDHSAACIDGLCIIFTKNALNTTLEFDESFMFSHYDTDISFQAQLMYNLKLGVIIDLSLQHYSVGRSIQTPEFLEYEKIFRTKWDKYLKKGAV